MLQTADMSNTEIQLKSSFYDREDMRDKCFEASLIIQKYPILLENDGEMAIYFFPSKLFENNAINIFLTDS